MYRPPPLRGQPILDGRKVLLIDANQPTRDVRIRVLQSHGVEVRAADSFSGHFAFLVGPPVYLSRTWPGEVIEVDASLGQWGATVRRFLAAA